MKFRNLGDAFKSSKQGWLRVVAISAVAACAYLLLPQIPAVSAKGGSYTYGDLWNYTRFATRLAEDRGIAAPSLRDAARQLQEALNRKAVLAANGFPYGEIGVFAGELEQRSPYRGIMLRYREDLGSERYLRVLVEPAMTEGWAGDFWLQRNAASLKAKEAIKTAQTQGIDAAAKAAGVEISRNVTIPAAAAGQPLMNAAKQGGVIGVPVVDAAGHAVISVHSVNETEIVADVVTFKHEPVSKFYLDGATALKAEASCFPSFLCGGGRK